MGAYFLEDLKWHDYSNYDVNHVTHNINKSSGIAIILLFGQIYTGWPEGIVVH